MNENLSGRRSGVTLMSLTGAVLMVLLVGCGGLKGELDESGFASDETQSAPSDDAPAASAPLVPSSLAVPVERVIGAPAAEIFDFEAVELLRGATLLGAELLGQPTVMTFISPDCEFSVEEGRELAAAAERHPDITFLVGHAEGRPDDYVAFVEEADLFGQNVIHLDDTAGDLIHRLGVTAFPSTVLLSVDLELSIAEGALETDGFDRAVERVG